MTSANNTGARIWDPVLGLSLSDLLPGGEAACFSPDGRWIATGDANGLRVYERPRMNLRESPFLPRLAELLGGLRFDASLGTEDPVPPGEWDRLRAEITQTGFDELALP